METIEDWLGQLGLGKYLEAFVQNDVDLRALPFVSEADLQELGVSLGHRKIILAASKDLRSPVATGPLLLRRPLLNQRLGPPTPRRNRPPIDGFSVYSSVT